MISAMILICGYLSVTTRKIFRAAIYLLFCLIGIAALFFFLENDFIAAVQIVVYVGGIVVLIIFSIFLTHKSGEEMPMASLKKEVAALAAVVSGFILVFYLIHTNTFIMDSNEKVAPTVNNIGTQMLSTDKFGYVLPFEVVSMLLLAAMIGAIVIAIKVKPKQ
ncbi:MAG: NADH-quinone oxidoreductase subunit J [Bacteroidota bacterium]